MKGTFYKVFDTKGNRLIWLAIFSDKAGMWTFDRERNVFRYNNGLTNDFLLGGELRYEPISDTEALKLSQEIHPMKASTRELLDSEHSYSLPISPNYVALVTPKGRRERVGVLGQDDQQGAQDVGGNTTQMQEKEVN